MTQEFKSVTILPAGCEQVFSMLTDPHAIEALEKELGAHVARCERKEPPGAGVVFSVYTEKPGHGGDDKLARSTRTTTWEADKMRGRWVHLQHGQEKRARVEGTVRLQPQDEGCRLTIEGEIQIRVPIVGKFIEKKVVESFEQQREKERRFFETYLSKL